MDETNPKAPAPASQDQPDVTSVLQNLQRGLDEKLSTFQQEMRNFKQEVARKLPGQQPQQRQERPKVDIWEDADTWGEHLAEKVSNSTEERILQKLQVQKTREATENYLYSEFPELKDQNSPLFKKANEHYMAQGIPEGQLDPMALKYAVSQAALDLGVAPKSKRKAEVTEDGFQLGGKGGAPKRSKGKDGAELTDKTLAFAALTGLDVNDPKVVERLKKRAERDSWSNYRGTR